MFEIIEHSRLVDLHLRHDEISGLKAIIAIHNTRFGPALGGCRCLYYPSDDAAIRDAIQLAQGMSYKAALAGLPQGGGKGVILLPEDTDKVDRPALYRAFGDFIESLGGRYITAVDSGTNIEDLDYVAERTSHVVGTSRDGYDPSPMTALGVLTGIRAAAHYHLHRDHLRGLRIAIQGVGNVGASLARHLANEGAHLLLSDLNRERVCQLAEELGAEVIEPTEIYDCACEIFSPCGLGAILNPQTIPRLRCQIVAGSANNQLAPSSQAGELLQQRGILYAPDYVINAGGLIRASLAHAGQAQEVPGRIEHIATTLGDIFQQAELESVPTSAIAERMAYERLYGKEPSHAHCR